MAGVINDKNKLAQEPASTAKAATSAPVSAPTAVAKASGTTTSSPLKGVSQNTNNMLNQYSQGYQQGSNVQAAQSYLNNVLNSKPTADAQLFQLYDQIMNQQQFTYDLNGDALYQQYKDQYQNMGKQAMMDTMGNATALTGGYGSSYASTAGNQAYQQYLQQLNNIVPELYEKAYDRYNQEKTDLMNRYNLAYGQHRDAVGDWENERDYANSEYWKQYDADYADYQNMFNYWNQLAQQENANFYNDRDYAYNLAMAMIKKGTLPSSDLLEMAGMSPTDAKNLAKKYGYGASSGGSSGGSKKSSGSGNNNKKPDTSGNSNISNIVNTALGQAQTGANIAGAGSNYNNLLQQFLSK